LRSPGCTRRSVVTAIAVVERGDPGCHLVQDVEMPIVARGLLDEVEEDWSSYSSRSCDSGASSAIRI
jgi:hypothetical protein